MGSSGTESPGWFDISSKTSAQDVMHEWAPCCDEAANHHSSGLLNHLNSFHRGIFKLNANLMQICCFTHSVILNVMATQYICSLNSIYRPPLLITPASASIKNNVEGAPLLSFFWESVDPLVIPMIVQFLHRLCWSWLALSLTWLYEKGRPFFHLVMRCLQISKMGYFFLLQ